MARKKFTLEEVSAAIEEGNQGFCAACGEQQDGVESDAAKVECENCGESQVYGAEELIMEGLVE